MQNIEEYRQIYKDIVAKYKDMIEDIYSSTQYVSLFHYGQKDYSAI